MSYPTYRDDFEELSVNPRKWRARQIEPRQISFSRDPSSANQSIVITVVEGDGGVSCSKPCQRAELRTHGRLRPMHDDEFWQGFAFRVTGDIAPMGSLRTVLGQWKSPGDVSPFLAQRFDNGIFHVTVQDGPNRRTVASAKGDPHRLDRFQDLVAELNAANPGAVQTAHILSQLRAGSGNGILTDNATTEGGQTTYLARAASALEKIEPDESQALFDEFSFIQELESYALQPEISIRRVVEKKLPDPKRDWVRMAYRIKPGRLDNDPFFGPRREGEIDIYANGELYAEVRGNLGYRLLKEPTDRTVYFKFGIYRDLTAGSLQFHFDAFRQGAERDDVM